MTKWIRHLYQPGLPLGEDGRRVTGSAGHIELSRRGAAEGMVLLKNENNTLPVKKGVFSAANAGRNWKRSRIEEARLSTIPASI